MKLACNLMVLVLVGGWGGGREPQTASEGSGLVPEGMVFIPAGEFWMGCSANVDTECGDEEKPGREVYLDAFVIDKTEVTVKQYGRCVQAGRCKKPKSMGKYCNWKKSGRGRHPINGVDWNDAKAYCEWAGKRLPTEAEWEKAARGTDKRMYPWGNQEASCAYAVMDDGEKGCGKDLTWPVCSKEKGNSSYGLCDMAGNVWEWVADRYGKDYYSSGPGRNPSGPGRGKRRVLRGGSWNNFPVNVRSSFRYRRFPIGRYHDIGFRCSRSAASQKENERKADLDATRHEEPAKKEVVRAPGGFVHIPAGSFQMGSPAGEKGRGDDEGPQHRATITRAFFMQATEVTQGQYRALMGKNPSRFTSCGDDCPVEQVSWRDAVTYCNALSRKEGLEECYDGDRLKGLDCKGYRLPTEAEWEYAVRAGSAGASYGELDAIAWYGRNSDFYTHPVGKKKPNAWGLYDMLGNVWEWCHDWKGDYPSGAVEDPTGPQAGLYRVSRGSSWCRYARDVRAASRRGDAPDRLGGSLGLRPVRYSP